MATEIERLTAVLEADISRFNKGMSDAEKVFNSRATEIERRQRQLQDKLSLGWGEVGNAVRGALGALGASVSAAAFIQFAKGVFESTAALVDQAQQAGVNVEALQSYNAIALQSGVSSETMERAVAKLTGVIGEAQTGSKTANDALAKFGVTQEDMAQGTERVLQVIAQAAEGMRLEGKAAQESAALNAVFGDRIGHNLIPALQDLISPIDEVIAKEKELGVVMSKDTVEAAKRLEDELSLSWLRIKATASPAIIEVMHQLEDFLSGYDHITGEVVRKSEQMRVSFIAAFGAAKAMLDGLFPSLGATLNGPATVAKGGDVKTTSNLNFLGSGLPVDQHHAGTSSDDVVRLEEQRQKEIARTLAAAIAAEAELTRATDAANVERARGTAAYYAAEIKAANDDLDAELRTIAAKEASDIASLKRRELGEKAYAEAVTNIHREEDAKRQAAFQKQQQALVQANQPLTDAIHDAEERIRATQEETATIGLYGAALDEAKMRLELLHVAQREGRTVTAEEAATIDTLARTYARVAEAQRQAQLIEQRSVQLQDSFRQGLEDVGVAALHGSDSFKEAAKQMLMQLAELIFRLGVLKPLIESVFGQQGQSGGGLLGSLLSSIAGSIAGAGGGFGGGGLTMPGPTIGPGDAPLLGFASGGDVVGGRPIIVGERGVELFVPKTAGTIIPRLPSVPRAIAGGGDVHVTMTVPTQISLDGARGDKEIVGMVKAAHDAAVNKSFATVRKAFPGLVAEYKLRSE